MASSLSNDDTATPGQSPQEQGTGSRLERTWNLLAARLQHVAAWHIWVTLGCLAILSKLHTEPSPGNVYHIYVESARAWLAGRELYEVPGFFYFPTATWPFVPLVDLSFVLGGAIWRACNLLFFAFGTWRFTRDCSGLANPSKWFPLISLVVALLSHSCVRHGQMTLAMVSFMMLGVSFLQRERWWLAGLMLAAAVATKPLALVLFLIAPFLYPRVLPSLLVFGSAFFALPFAFQDPSYVWEQYRAIPEMLRAASNREAEIDYYHLPELLETLGLSTSLETRTVLRLAFAVPTLALCWLMHRRSERDYGGFLLFSLACSYILLFGSGTERNTYALMMPTLAVLLARGVADQDRRAIVGLGVTTAALLLLSSALSRSFPGTPLAMMKVWVCLALIVLVVRIGRRTGSGQEAWSR